MRFEFDKKKSALLRNNPKQGIGFEEAIELWSHLYYLDERSDNPTQYRAIGWVRGELYSVIFEMREEQAEEIFHLVTLWKSTKEEERLYEKNS
jgi:uncharacterized DUF497 family protein